MLALRNRWGRVLGMAAVAVSAMALPARVHAYPNYPGLVPNPVMAAGSAGTQQACITCHNNPDGGDGCVGTTQYASSIAPCLNPFGMAFQLASHVWSPTLAQQDSDNDGFTNGEELQDPLGTWAPGQASPGHATYATRPGFPDDNPGKHDMDGDRWCWIGQDMNADGSCLESGENGISVSQGDCDDSDPAVHPGATEICTNTKDDDCNGLDTLHDPACQSVVDADGDGYCPSGRDLNGNHNCLDPGEMGTPGDCNDANPLVNPGVTEICANGLDDDCNGQTDLADSACSPAVDNDSDHYCPIGQDLDNNFRCNDSQAELDGPSDCNDRQATVHPGATELCGDGLDNDCNGKADFADPACASVTDGDHDGYCPDGIDSNANGNCADPGEQGAASDCNDADPSIHPNATEVCTDNVDHNCDGKAGLADPTCARYLDQDLDTYCGVGIDKNGNHNCTDSGEIQPYIDCNDMDPSIHYGAPEVCTNGVDDNCNGSVDAADPGCAQYRDTDRDTYCSICVDTNADGICESIGQDMNGDGDCSDMGEQPAGTLSDWEDTDPTIYPGAPENCIDMHDNDEDGLVDLADPDCNTNVDADSDGYCPYGIDLDHDGQCTGTELTKYRVSDCNDHNPAINPAAIEAYVDGANPEPCFDHLDNNCNGEPDLWDLGCEYVYDMDHDGYCGHGIDDNLDGDCLDPDEQRYGADCNDQNAMVNPGEVENCSNGIDDDCNGLIDGDDPQCPCTADTQCQGNRGTAGMCQVNVCMSGACVTAPDPACATSKSGCNTAGTGTDALPLACLLLVALASVAVSRRRRT